MLLLVFKLGTLPEREFFRLGQVCVRWRVLVGMQTDTWWGIHNHWRTRDTDLPMPAKSLGLCFRQCDHTAKLNDDMLLLVFKLGTLPEREFFRLGQVCVRWRVLVGMQTNTWWGIHNHWRTRDTDLPMPAKSLGLCFRQWHKSQGPV